MLKACCWSATAVLVLCVAGCSYYTKTPKESEAPLPTQPEKPKPDFSATFPPKESAVIYEAFQLIAAEEKFKNEDPKKDGTHEYTQAIKGMLGKWGLYQKGTMKGEDIDPKLIRQGVAEAVWGEGGQGRPPVFQGYYFRMLPAQGKLAPGGAKSFQNGPHVEGWAAVIWPGKYDVTARMTYMVSHHGKVYEKDLGEDSFALAAGMMEFNPDDTWKVVDKSRGKAAPPNVGSEPSPDQPMQPHH